MRHVPDAHGVKALGAGIRGVHKKLSAADAVSDKRIGHAARHPGSRWCDTTAQDDAVFDLNVVEVRGERKRRNGLEYKTGAEVDRGLFFQCGNANCLGDSAVIPKRPALLGQRCAGQRVGHELGAGIAEVELLHGRGAKPLLAELRNENQSVKSHLPATLPLTVLPKSL